MSVSCAICMISYEEDENGKDIVAIKCGHVFHKECILEWRNSARYMTCPECRNKYSVRSFRKLYLNILEKDPDAIMLKELNEKLQDKSSQLADIQKERDHLFSMQHSTETELFHARQEVENLVHQSEDYKMKYDIKVQKYSLISKVNDELVKTNEEQREENLQLKYQLVNLRNELAEIKLKQFRTSKPFVDLTNDVNSDDSDVEIIEAEQKSKKLDVEETIEITDDGEHNEKQDNSQTDGNGQSQSLKNQNSLKRPSTEIESESDATSSKNSRHDDSLLPIDLQEFENFILGQI